MPEEATITINDNQWNVWVASTYTELTTGLSGREAIPAGTGMLFVLGVKRQVTVDTSQMLFPIDIIFISESLVIDVANNIQPGYLVTEETNCDSFLEVNAGEAAGVEVGDVVSTVTIQQPGFDFSQIMSFVIPVAALGFVCVMARGVMETAGGGSSSSPSSSLSSGQQRQLGEPKTEAERREAHERKYGSQETPARGTRLKESEYGTCYEDAWRFLIKEEEGYLIHGTILSNGKRIGHAWVETLTGYIWEPQTKRFYTREAFQKIAEPVEESRYTTEEAAIMLARVGKHGPWTEEEKRQILSREHHSMWLTPEQRKNLQEKYGMVAVRWAEEATKPGDIRAAERAAEYYYRKVKEALGLGHLSPELTEEQLKKLREVLGLTADVGEILKIHRETGYVP